MGLTAAQEAKFESERIAANKRKAPSMCNLAEVIFDLRDKKPSEYTALEDLAVTLDGAAQAGHEITPRDAVQVVKLLAAILVR